MHDKFIYEHIHTKTVIAMFHAGWIYEHELGYNEVMRNDITKERVR